MRRTLPYSTSYSASYSTSYSAAVLAGGRSRRFGVDKARYKLGGETLLTRVLKSFPDPAERFVVANRAYAEVDVPVYGDVRTGGDSLSGLHAALYHAAQPWVAVAACDTPFLTADYWRLLLARRTGVEAVVVKGEWLEPLAALYHVSLLPLVETLLETDQLRLSAVAKSATTHYLSYDDVVTACGASVLTNLNRLTDLPASFSEPETP